LAWNLAVALACSATHAGEAPWQAALLRELINPFQLTLIPSVWSSQILDISAALYAGQDCAFALHDALLEAGREDLAQHFRANDHPKGCWVLDFILGKQ
jgi:hypothetical protein